MAAINFPTSPTVNDVYTVNNRSWVWDGTSWVANTFADNYYTKTETDAGFDPAGSATALSIALG